MAIQHSNYNPDLKYGAVADEGDLAITEGSILVGNSSGLGTELDASGNGDILVGDGTTLKSSTMGGDATIASNGQLTIESQAVGNSKIQNSNGSGGLFIQKTAHALYDFSTDGGTAGTITLSSTSNVPNSSFVTAGNYVVLTTCTSGTDASTIALSVETDGAISTAIAISDGSNPWDQGPHLASVITPIANATTDNRALQIVVAGGENLTAGKILFTADYFLYA